MPLWCCTHLADDVHLANGGVAHGLGYSCVDGDMDRHKARSQSPSLPLAAVHVAVNQSRQRQEVGACRNKQGKWIPPPPLSFVLVARCQVRVVSNSMLAHRHRSGLDTDPSKRDGELRNFTLLCAQVQDVGDWPFKGGWYAFVFSMLVGFVP